MREIFQAAHSSGLTRIAFREPLSAHTSWRVGGPAEIFVEPDTPEQVSAMIRAARYTGVPMLILGHGSNLLISDRGFSGLVIKIGQRMARQERIGNRIHAQAGAWVPGLAWAAGRSGLSGLEHVIGIPGTLGGLVVMNGGSLRRSIGDNVVSVSVIDSAGDARDIAAGSCQFGYRTSVLQAELLTATAVVLECKPGDPKTIRKEMLDILRARRRKFPRKALSCGSVFMSTPEIYRELGAPGRIIEAVGMKGFSIGGAEVSHLHANFVVNRGGATSADILAVIRAIRRRVKHKFGVELPCEVRYVEFEGKVVPAHLASA